MSRLPCPPAMWPRFSALLDSALDLPPPARAPWLEQLAGEDETLRPLLARVLASEAGLETDYLRARPNLLPEGSFTPGDAVGPYTLETRLGEGGMGEVWRAARADDGPRRVVALKLPHAELLGGPFRQRFARERDVLAALSHPHIAQLYDAGLSAEGHPYLALELVEGLPINEACTAQRLSLERRVDLVREVLDALTYAHQRLIVHRDIKPSNVLVTPEGGVKLLDFGIAKLLRPSDAADTRMTVAATRLATPAYAAPEQLTDGEITVATDIFAAGVLLFELCTGQRPFRLPPLGQDAREAPLASQSANAEEAGIGGGVKLVRALRGDLDAVIARALALEPRDRYSSAEAFARDLARWRDGLPVAARRVGWAARGLKFARRNKVGVGLAAVLVLALVGGTAGIAWQARVAAGEAARASREAANANAVKNYLIGLFAQSDPHGGGKPAETMTAKELLDRSTDRADAAFAGQPEVELELLATLGEIYGALEDSKHNMQINARRLELARKLYGAGDQRVIDGTLDLADSKAYFLDPAGARELLLSIRAPLYAKYGADSLERARFLVSWCRVLRTEHGMRDEALADSRQAVSIYRAHSPTNEYYPLALYELAVFQFQAEQYEATLATLRQRQTVLAAQASTDPIDRMGDLIEAGQALRHLGRYDEAEKVIKQCEALAERVVGRRGGYYIAAISSRALIENELGRRAQAMALFGEGMGIGANKGAAIGIDAAMRRFYGTVLATDGDAAPAIPMLEEALRQTQIHPVDEQLGRIAQGALGDAYDQVGRADEARAALHAARDEWVRYGVPAGEFTLGARERWARFLLEHGDLEGAQAECTALLRVAADAPSAPAAAAQADLARVALLRGDARAADQLSARAMQTIEAARQGYDVRMRTDIWLARGEILLANGQKPQAAELAARASAAAAESDAVTSRRLARARALVEKTK